MVDDDGLFELVVVREGIPGVVEASAFTVQGELSSAGLVRYRAITSKNSPEVAMSALRRAVARRLAKRGSEPGALTITSADFKG